jgi:hypothetical protein
VTAIGSGRAEVSPRDGEASLAWRVVEADGGTVVELVGEIDENADFAELKGRLAGAVTFDLAEVRRINSCGVREWVNFVRELPAVRELAFRRCSPAVITQLNMIFNFRGRARVLSFYAPYVCDHCGHEIEHLIDAAAQSALGRSRVPDVTCAKCAQPMSFDDIPDRYLSFLVE